MNQKSRLATASIEALPVPAGVSDGYRRHGYINDQTISMALDRAVVQWPDRPALIEAGRSFTYRELNDLVQRAAAWLVGAGLQAGDVVCWQTPNWWEAHVLGLAIWQIGAVSNPIVPFYREYELGQILEQIRPAAVITVETYRSFDHAAAFDEILHSNRLHDVIRILLRGARPGWSDFDDLVTHDKRQPPAVVAATEPCLVLFTSGTTSAPKGAVHSSQSLLAETRQLADAWSLGWEDVAYMAAPLQHVTGVLNAMSIPLITGACAVLAERWLPDVAVQDILRHRVSYTAGATVFLQELTEATHAAGTTLPLKNFACGGAAIPRSIMEASEEQGIPASRVYGMTELPTVTVMNRSHSFAARAETDGAIAAGVEVRIVDGDHDVPAGEPGELLVRGPERMLGYLSPAANRVAIDLGGWFRTGDVGVVDGAGLVSITGRLKDVINRGGEKFSTREIEDLLVGHPAVRAAAVVPGADRRLGEVPVAFVVVDDESATGADLAAHLTSMGLARQKAPVAWHVVPELPMTSSGKIKKHELIDRLDPVDAKTHDA